MHRSDLIEEVRVLLARAGFAVSERCDLRPVSFDLVARRDGDLILLKVLTNVDALQEPIAHEMKLLCKFLEARPMLVGLRAGTGMLEDGVVYARHDIPIVTPTTLAEQVLEDAAPMVFAAPGGFYVHLDPDELRRARTEAQMSLGMMAKVAGVSRRAIQMYEQGMSASIEAAARLEDALGADLIVPLDPLRAFDAAAYQAPDEEPPQEPVDPTEHLVRTLLEGMGYTVRSTRRSPFDAVSQQKKDTLLTGLGQDSPALRRRAKIVSSITRITERPGFFVVERTTRTSIEGVPAMNRRELTRLNDPQAILDLILERRERQRTDVE